MTGGGPSAGAPAGRLAIITNDYPPRPGGIQQYLGNLVDAFPGDVMVLAPRDGAAAATARGEQVVRRYPSRFMWPTAGVAAWLGSQIASFRPDHVLFGAPHPLTALAGRLRASADVPYGVICHGAEITIPAALPGSRQVLAKWLRDVDVRFAVSRFTAERVGRLTGRDVTYIGAGVDHRRFAPHQRPSNEVPVVGCVSRFVPRKGQHRLIDAVAAVGREGWECELLLVGKGRSEERLRRRAREAGITARLAVDVPWNDLPGYYASMDVFCMPCKTRWGGLEIEGLGLVFLEAAAAGLPVLAGNSGGAPETVVPGITGYVVDDVGSIAQGLAMVLGDPAAAAEMGRRGRARVAQEFTWARVAERLMAGFRSV